MSLQQLEAAIRALPPEDRWRLAEWFEDHRAELLGESDDDLSEEQEAEILRRRDAFLADPSQAEPWEGTAERVRQHLHARRAQKTAASGH